MAFFTISCCLPVWSLTTNNVLDPVARLYNRALKIHCKLPGWAHHRTALSKCDALTFESYVKSVALEFYFQIKNNCLSPD